MTSHAFQLSASGLSSRTRLANRVPLNARRFTSSQASTRPGRRPLTIKAFIPSMIPNPAYRWGDDLNPNAPQKASLDDMLVKKHGKWQVGHERGADDKDTLWRKFKARDSKSARDLLDKLQDTLYVQNEQGCRIRRETQGMFYMCCDGVRVRLNEPKREILVEIPLPNETYAAIESCDRTLAQVEETCKAGKAN
mmetsp:Transcript_4296/g.15880  ORF Transcript_4296/g.15880 Transcript_4296/m.15880 type:complete len:194 (+) Transcript_4296:136-717(+)